LTHLLPRFIKLFCFLLLISNSVAVLANVDIISHDTKLGAEVDVEINVSDVEGIVDIFLLTPGSLKLPIDSFSFEKTESYQKSINLKSLFLSQPGNYYLIAVSTESKKLLASDTFHVENAGFFQNLFAPNNAVGGNEDLLAQANGEEEPEIIAGIENPRFRFVDFPETVAVFEEISFTLEAIDVLEELDTDYLGEITFEVLDDQNATVPTNFSFEEDHAGSHQFNTSIRFSNTGEQILRVFDINDETIEAAIKIMVTQEQEQAQSQITLSSPTPGITNNNRVVFEGTTDVGVQVEILEGNSLLDTTSSNADGAFTYTTSPLADGDYSFVVKTENAISEAINISIDSMSANLTSFNFAPQPVIAGQVFTTNLVFDSEVSSASIIVNGLQTNLTAIDASEKRFSASAAAPLLPDTYEVSVVVVDKLGSSNSFVIQEPLNVIEAPSEQVVTDGADTNLDPGFVIPDFTQGNVFGNPPTAPTNIIFQVADKRIDLAWDASSDDLGIAFYSIKYGIDPNNLELQVETATDEAVWFIPNLANNMRYFVQVFAVDLDGNTSAGSQVVAIDVGRPGSTSYYGAADPGVDATGTYLDANAAAVGGPDLTGLITSETGPSNMLLVLFSLVGGGYLVRKPKGK
jgi:hypothetical protein